MGNGAFKASLVILIVFSSFMLLPSMASPAADNDNDGFDSAADCDDNDPHINPAAPELCNLKDDDCDLAVDEGCTMEAAFEYLIEANGTHLPVQFNWTLQANVTETWYTNSYMYSGFICYWCFGGDGWECPGHSGWSVLGTTHAYGGNDGSCCCPTGLYSSPGLQGGCDDTTTYYCTYRHTETHTQTLDGSDSGSAAVNPDYTVTGDTGLLINFADNPDYRSGDLSELQVSLAIDNPDVSASESGTLSGTVYSGELSAESDATGPWSGQETGSGTLAIGEADKLVHVSGLEAPSHDTVYRILSTKINGHYYYDADVDGVIEGGSVIAWMSGKNLYASSSNLPPQAYIDSITPAVAEKGDEVSLSGHGEDEDGVVEGYKWESHLDGLLSVLSSFTTTALSFGTHVVYLSVQDNDELWSPRDTGRVKVNRKPVPMIYSLGRGGSGVSGEPVLLAGKGVDPDGYVAGYSWRSDRDGYLGDSDVLSVSDFSVGIHKIYLKVMDNDGSWSSEVEGELVVRRTPVIYIHGYPFWEFPGNYRIEWHDDVIDPLAEWGLAPNMEFFPSKSSIPYYAGVLDDAVLELKRRTGAEKVDIVGHSMGGLIGRWYIQMNYRGDVRKFISIAGPQHGSDWAYLSYLIPPFAGEAGMEMSPHSWLYHSLNHNDKCATWGEGIDYTRPGIHYAVIAGSGFITPAHKHFCIDVPDWLEWLFGSDICIIIPWLTSNGDGIVPVRSAFISDTSIDIVTMDHGHMQIPFVVDDQGKILAKGVQNVYNLVSQVYNMGGFLSYIGLGAKAIGAYNAFMAIMMDDEIYSIVKEKLLDDPPPVEDTGWSEGNITRAYHWFDPVYGALSGPGSASHAFEMDFTMEDAVFLLHADGNTGMIIHTPSGGVITKDTPGINVTSAEGILSYQVADPESGNWTAEVLLEEDPGYEVNYTLLAFARTWVFVGVGLDKEIYEPGETMNILTFIQHSNPVPSDITGSLEITRPDKTVERISLNRAQETPVLQKAGMLSAGEGAPKTNETRHSTFNDTDEMGEYRIKSTVTINKTGKNITRKSEKSVWVELFPDLWVLDSGIAFSSGSPGHGEAITISAEVHNSGELDVSGVKAVFYDGDPNVQGIEIGTDYVDITANGVSTASVSWQCSYGGHDIFIVINPHDAISELDRDNNKASKAIQVSDDVAPVADAGSDQIVVIAEPVILDGSGSWDNVGVSHFSWDTDLSSDSGSDGIPDNDEDLAGERAVIEAGFGSPGLYAIQLTVTDQAGNTDSDVVVINVTDNYDTTAPTADAGPDSQTYKGDAVPLDAGGSSDNFGISIYSWDLDASQDSDQDGVPGNDVNLLGEQAEHVGYQECGTYTVTLSVDDMAGNGPVSDSLDVDIVLRGDANSDNIVSIFDLALVGLTFWVGPGDPNWDPDADLNGDGVINIFDLATVGLNYGQTC